MKTPLYKDFRLLRSALSTQDLTLAESQIRKIKKRKLPEAAAKLLTNLTDSYLDAGGKQSSLNLEIKLPELKPSTPDGPLSDFDKRKLLDGVSLVSCCMNRNDNLKKSLKSWLKLPVQEIVIVDWNSDIPVSDSIADIRDERVRVIRVENEQNWILTYAFNVGLRFASYKRIFKLDADIETSDDFLSLNYFEEGEFIRGSWEIALEEDRGDQVYINGSFGCLKSDLLKIGFYNEHIRSYGWDDSDLYSRLSQKCSLTQKYLAFDSLSHIHQEQEERLKHQDVTQSTFLKGTPATEITNSLNKFTVALYDQWWPTFLQDYMITCQGENDWTCERSTEHREIPRSILKDAQKYAVLENLFRANPAWSDVVYNLPWMADFIFEQYVDEVPFDQTASALLLDGQAHGYFDDGISPYRVLSEFPKNAPGHPSHESPCLYVFEGRNERYQIELSGQNFVIQGLDEKRYRDLKELNGQSNHQGLFSSGEATSEFLQPDDPTGSKRILAISLYDESNPERLDEYLESLKQNLQHFEALAIFYEKSSGEMQRRVIDILGSLKPVPKANLVWINIKNRPTFEEIFDAVDFIFPQSIVVVSNADIAFDSSICEVTTDVLQDSFLVISRQEIPECTGGYGGYIMNQFSLPNGLPAL